MKSAITALLFMTAAFTSYSSDTYEEEKINGMGGIEKSITNTIGPYSMGNPAGLHLEESRSSFEPSFMSTYLGERYEGGRGYDEERKGVSESTLRTGTGGGLIYKTGSSQAFMLKINYERESFHKPDFDGETRYADPITGSLPIEGLFSMEVRPGLDIGFMCSYKNSSIDREDNDGDETDAKESENNLTVSSGFNYAGLSPLDIGAFYSLAFYGKELDNNERGTELYTRERDGAKNSIDLQGIYRYGGAVTVFTGISFGYFRSDAETMRGSSKESGPDSSALLFGISSSAFFNGLEYSARIPLTGYIGGGWSRESEDKTNTSTISSFGSAVSEKKTGTGNFIIGAGLIPSPMATVGFEFEIAGSGGKDKVSKDEVDELRYSTRIGGEFALGPLALRMGFNNALISSDNEISDPGPGDTLLMNQNTVNDTSTLIIGKEFVRREISAGAGFQLSPNVTINGYFAYPWTLRGEETYSWDTELPDNNKWINKDYTEYIKNGYRFGISADISL
ncbi:MAG: hypothetical protein ACLFQK_04210 [Fibrobacterota bacterium]